MDIWKQICARESAKLESALELYKHARELASHGGARKWIRNEDIRKLEEAKKNIDQKLSRLRNGEFHIAVVGTEKAGKSSFINAWLEWDLLPNNSKRCTFTTTKLHSLDAGGRQRLEVLPKTREEFSRLREILQKEAQGTGKEADDAREDLEAIGKHESQMLDIIDEGAKTIPFDDLEQIASDLERYAADPQYAHAIKKVDLYTKKLASMDGVLFYDVPGLNSGLSKHERETKEMLADSDAVIIVKSIERPDLDGPEKQILRFAEADASVALKDKVFLFASKIDKESTRDGLVKNRNELLESCKSLGIDENKVVLGSAPAVLVLLNKLKDQRYISGAAELKDKLRRYLDLPDDSDETILKHAGVKGLRDKIDDYLENDREKILKNSVDRIIAQLEQGAIGIHNAVRAMVPDDPDALRNQHDENISIAFGEWYNGFWEEIKARLSDDKSMCQVRACIDNMENSYKANVEDRLGRLPHFLPEKQEQFFSAEKARRGAEDYEIFNANLRVEINKETMCAMQELSRGLSWDLFTELCGYMKNLSGEFKDSLDVKGKLFETMGIGSEDEYRHQLESALSALFLRLVRPLARALMKHRHGLPERREEVKKFGGVYRSLSELYPDEQPDKYADLPRYLAYGAGAPRSAGSDAVGETAKKASSRMGERILKKTVGAASGAVLGGALGAAMGAAMGDAVIDRAADMLSQAPKVSYSSREDIRKELEEDREALKLYLLHAVFACSGIGDYADQELLRIREKFIVDCEIKFKEMAGAAFRRRDARFMPLLPPHLQDVSCDTQIADRLKQLSTSLKQRNIPVSA